MNIFQRLVVAFIVFFVVHTCIFVYSSIADAKEQHVSFCEADKVYLIKGIASSGGLTVKDLIIESSSVANDIQQLKSGEMFIPLLMDHVPSVRAIIGRVVDLRIEGKSIAFSAIIRDTDRNHYLIEQIKSGEVKGVSMGFDALLIEDDVVIIMDLVEISLVYVGADEFAQITSIERIDPWAYGMKSR